jgi:preprotein translocase subunit SecE
VGARTEGGGSIGRAAVSKTAGCRFESCPPCAALAKEQRWLKNLAGTAGIDERLDVVARNVVDEPSEDLVANAKRDRDERRNPFARIALFIRQVLTELSKVVRPTRRELLSYTGVVIVFVVIMMAIIYGLDFVFGWAVAWVFGDGAAFIP